jgi:hypothetical protein
MGIARSVALIAAGMGLVVAAVLGWAWRERVWLQGPVVASATRIEDGLLRGIDRWQARARRKAVPAGLLLGNSLIRCGKSPSIGTVTEQQLGWRGHRHAIQDVWAGAFGPLQYYYVLDALLAAAPRLAIVEVDFARAGFSDVAPHLRYVSLSRLLTIRRALRVREALAADGLTLVDPLIFRLEARFGVLHLVPGVQHHWRAFLDDAGIRLDAALGLETARAPALPRPWVTAARVREVFGAPTDVSTGVLRAIAQELHGAGVMVLFYVAPVDVELLRKLGVWNELGLPDRIASMREQIGLVPDEWLDLHAAIPAEQFRDWMGHLTPTGCARVGRSIAEALVARLDASRSPRATRPRSISIAAKAWPVASQ